MKTKPPEPISTAFPTCGEAFHYLITALDLTAWAHAFPISEAERHKASSTQSDKLRDWATETEGRVPSREELDKFIRELARALPKGENIAFVLCSIWGRVLEGHADMVRENTTFLDGESTRARYARWQAPGTLYHLWALQKLLRRVANSDGPMLAVPLNDLLAMTWPDSQGAESTPAHPLHKACFAHYARIHKEDSYSVDAKTTAAWKSGEDRPSFDALGRHFSQIPDKRGLVLNFAFAGLLEALAHTFKTAVMDEDWPECRRMLLGQARCVHDLDAAVATELTSVPQLSLTDYERLLAACLGDYIEFLRKLPRGVDALDLRVARFRVYEEYQQTFANPKIPAGFDEFHLRLDDLWKNTAPHRATLKAPSVEAELAKLRAAHPGWCTALAGPLLAIEARLALCQEPPTEDSLQGAFSLYQKAFSTARYWAGTYTARIAREALGLGAMLHRRETGEGSIVPWMKKVLGWWDLLGLGSDFDHEQLEQRIELAESWFTDRLEPALRDRLRATLPQLGLTHWNVGGLFGFVESGLIEQLEATPVDRRQKNPMSDTIVGRDQTALMEAIDRGHLDLAGELVRKGADLNFVNSTGDTCVTKAFACSDYDLVLEILRRDSEPIRRDLLLRETTKCRHSALERALRLGRCEIVRELALWKKGRGDVIDLSRQQVLGLTPLYYLVQVLSTCRMSPEEYLKYQLSVAPMSRESQFLKEFLMAGKDQQDIMKRVRALTMKDENPDGVMECIKFLVNEEQVDLDVPNTSDNTALTLAAERQLHDVAAILLAAGANVNHRFQGGGTALVRAILNDDYEMAKLLLEYGADDRLSVDPPLKCPIYALPMSEKMRRLIPHPTKEQSG